MKPSGSGLGLVLLALAVLADWAGAADCPWAQGDAHSLCYILNVSATGQSWSEFLGTINGTPFFEYSCKSRVGKLVGPVGMMLNATKSCSQWFELCMEMLHDLWEALVHRDNISKDFDSLSLQGSMMCEQKFSGCCKMFWKFGFKGQMCLRFDSKNRSWTELHPGCSLLRETLESNSDISKRLAWLSNGDCVKLLNQSRVLDTKAAPTTAAASASSPTVSATPTMATTTVPAPSKAMNKENILWILLVIVFCVIVFGICCWSIYRFGWQNGRCCSKAPETGSSSRRVPSGWRPCCRRQVLPCDQELQPL